MQLVPEQKEGINKVALRQDLTALYGQADAGTFRAPLLTSTC